MSWGAWIAAEQVRSEVEQHGHDDVVAFESVERRGERRALIGQSRRSRRRRRPPRGAWRIETLPVPCQQEASDRLAAILRARPASATATCRGPAVLMPAEAVGAWRAGDRVG